jgi:lipopolysaccharide heptosyltransferase I
MSLGKLNAIRDNPRRQERDMAFAPIAGTTPVRILIVRLSAVGDVVHGVPVLNALRAAFPQAFLAWVVEQRAASLLRGHKSLDELIVVPRGWLKSPAAVWRLRRRLRSMRFDLTIDLQGLTKSAVAAWLSGAPRRIGFGGANGRELSPWLNNQRVVSTARHVIDCNLELLRPLGIESPEVRFDLPESPDDGAAAERIIREAKLEGRFAVINPGAGWPSKLWPPERFAAVARHLGGRGVPTVVVWGGQQERDWAAGIVAGSDGYGRLAPATSLTELAALARRACLFIASDTGPLHIAAAVGTPSIGLYGPMSGQRNGPYGSKHVILQPRQFEGTSRQRRHAPAELMAAITPEMVCQGCDQSLGLGS